MSEVFSTCRLKEHLEALPSEEEAISLPHNERVIGQIDHLVLTVGAVRVECAALVVGECSSDALGVSSTGGTLRENMKLQETH